MTQIAINKQIEAIKIVTQEALKTKQSALKFLIDAGIVEKNNHSIKATNPSKK